MTPISTYAHATLKFTLLTVRVDQETTGRFLDVAQDRDWTLTEAAFDRYISDRRRPYLPENLRAGDGCIALIDFEADPEEAAETASYLDRVFPGKLVTVALSRRSDPELLLLAMRAGCAEFLALPLDLDKLDSLCARLETRILARSGAPAPTGSIIAFFGAKGGVGTTTLAVHLASYLVQKHKKKVLLIDNHAQFGHACIYLGIDGSGYHFQELVRNVNRLDSELLLGFLGKHSSGLDVLSSPDVGHDMRAMDAADVASTLEFLRSEYDFVLVDCAAMLDDTNLAVISAASQVYVVATPEISAIRDLSRYVDDLARLEPTSQKVKVVLNRFSSQFAVSLAEIEKAIRLPVDFCIPNSYLELVRSVNLGVPMSSAQRSGFSDIMTRWANSLVGVSDSPAPKPSRILSLEFWKNFTRRLSALASISAAATIDAKRGA